jgi:cytochrome b
MMDTVPVRIWDLPTRLFHWTLLIGIAFSWFCAEVGGNWMEWHERSGIFLLALIVFRMVWGVIGSDTARFAQFVTSPVRAVKHLRELTSKETAFHTGHNPLGAWMVVALVGIVLFQAVTGLFATDDIATEGPLSGMVSGDTSKWLTTVHHWVFNVILLLAAVHVVTVLYYRFFKRTNLIKAMVVGKADWPASQSPPAGLRFMPAWMGLLVFGICYALVYFGISWLAKM